MQFAVCGSLHLRFYSFTAYLNQHAQQPGELELTKALLLWTPSACGARLSRQSPRQGAGPLKEIPRLEGRVGLG